MSGAGDAIQLVASVIALIEVAVKVVGRLKEFDTLSEEVPKSLRNLVVQLPLLSISLQRIHMQACAGNVGIDVIRALIPVIDETHDETTYVKNSLATILPPLTADRLTRGIAAIKSIAKEGRISQALDKIQGCTTLLVLHESISTFDISREVLEMVRTLVANRKPPLEEDTTALLHQACRMGLRRSMRVIINLPTAVDARDESSRTPLHTAALCGQRDIVRALCDNFNAPINSIDCKGQTPLHLAISNDEIETAWLLCQSGASLCIQDDNEQTPLTLIQDNAMAQWRIRHGMNINARDRKTGNTALIHAICKGDTAMAKSLIQEGADVNVTNVRLSTALAEACSRGNTEIVSQLLCRGADPNAVDMSNESAVTRCLLSNQSETLAILLRHGGINLNATSTRNRRTILLEAVYNHQWNMCEMLLQHGANPKHGDPPLPRVLMWCYDESTLEKLINTFVQAGANVNTLDTRRVSATVEAVSRRRFHAFRVLLTHGGDPNSKDNHYPLICRLSQVEEDVKWIRLLREFGADIEATNADGWVPLREAVHNSWPVIVSCLLELGANPNDRVTRVDATPGHSSLTLLMHAVWQGRMWEGTRYRSIIPALIKAGARLEDKDSKGWTALRTAIERGCEDIACLLLQYGANPLAATPDGLTVQTLAESKGMVDFCAQSIGY